MKLEDCDIIERSQHYKLSSNIIMQTGLFKFSWADFKSALIYGALWGGLTVAIKITEIGSIFDLNWKELIDIFAMTGLAIAITLVKNLLTTKDGNFLGAVRVKDPQY